MPLRCFAPELTSLCGDETSRPHLSRHDHVVSGCQLDRSTPGIRTGDGAATPSRPAPRLPASSSRSGANGVLDSLAYAQHVLELFRRTLTDQTQRRPFDRIANHLSKLISKIRKLTTAEK